MATTFTYRFTASGQSDVVVVTVATTATSSTSYGPGYNVTAISGTIGGNAISGEVGTGGQVQYTGNSGGFDNTIFTSGVSGAQGSYKGIDGLGIEFTVGSTSYNLYSTGASALHLYSPSARTTANVTLTSTDAPCYCHGTRIETASGDVPVQALAAGDVVLTASGEHRFIRWIGHRSYAGRFLTVNPSVQPVRFRAGSLGGGLPRRDLLVSPEHAMFLDGLLIPARHLVNGTTILPERGLDRVEYYHIELDTHDLLLAEGAPSESFLDDDSRCMFHNVAEWCEPHPSPVASPAVYCVRRVDCGPELEAIRRRLEALAGNLLHVA